MALESALWPANQKRTIFLNFHHSYRQLGKLNVRGEDEGATILQDEGVEASGLCGGFQLLDLPITKLKSHMTSYNSMPLIGWNNSIQTGGQIL